MFRLCVFVPPWWCLLYLHMREEVSAVSTLKPGSVWFPQFPRRLKAHFISFSQTAEWHNTIIPSVCSPFLSCSIQRAAASFSLTDTHLLHVYNRITCCCAGCVMDAVNQPTDGINVGIVCFWKPMDMLKFYVRILSSYVSINVVKASPIKQLEIHYIFFFFGVVYLDYPKCFQSVHNQRYL